MHCDQGGVKRKEFKQFFHVTIMAPDPTWERDSPEALSRSYSTRIVRTAVLVQHYCTPAGAPCFVAALCAGR